MSTIDVRDGAPVEEIQYSNTHAFRLVGTDIEIQQGASGPTFTIGNSSDLAAFQRAAELAARLWG